MHERYLVYTNVPSFCSAYDVNPEINDNPNYASKFLSMYDINKMYVYAVQLYKPEEYSIGSEIKSLYEDQLKQL